MAFPDNLRSLGELRSRSRRARRGGQPAGFRDTSRLIDQGPQLTARGLGRPRVDRPAPPDHPADRVARAC